MGQIVKLAKTERVCQVKPPCVFGIAVKSFFILFIFWDILFDTFTIDSYTKKQLNLKYIG